MDTLGKRLKKIREERGLTLRELGKLSHVSHSFIADIEADRSNPSINTLASLAETLGVDSNYFLESTNEESKVIYNEIENKVSSMTAEKVSVYGQSFDDIFHRILGPLSNEDGEEILEIMEGIKKLTPEDKRMVSDMVKRLSKKIL
jgi:transcriptional regulator with XRE-family HTH domain